jgi:hypothetical protein
MLTSAWQKVTGWFGGTSEKVATTKQPTEAPAQGGTP